MISPLEIDKWVNGFRVRAFPWVDGKRIYFNVQYFASGQSIEKPPIWDKTIYIVDNDNGKRLVFELTSTLVEHVAKMQIPNDIEVTLTT